MSGLLGAQMLRHHSPEVFEASPSLPNNHGALLRFRSNIITEATAIPLRRVTVQKAIKRLDGAISTEARLKDANAYALKVSGRVTARSAFNLAPGERYVAAPDFLDALARGVRLVCGMPLTADLLKGRSAKSDPIISTIPMPLLMEMVGWTSETPFQWRPIWTMRATIAAPVVDVYQTIYYPGSERYYRASLTGSLLTVEYLSEPSEADQQDDLDIVADDFGLNPDGQGLKAAFILKRQEYGKLVPLPDTERRAFVLAMSDHYNIYSLGRFATWRQILLDDVVQDVRRIEAFITERSSYGRRQQHWSPK